MVIFFYGTTGESIKIATLVESVPAKDRLLLDTNQQPKLLKKFYDATTFPQPNLVLSSGWRGNDLTKPWQMMLWLPRVLISFFSSGAARKIRQAKKKSPVVMVVHGDTVTTVVGAFLGRLLGLPVAHIEAGLRSGNWRHPFPEEIDRIIVSKFARLHYSPGKTPIKALKKESVKGEIIDTKANTVADSAKWAKKQKPENLPTLPQQPFCLVSVHRNEFLISPKALEAFIKSIVEFSKKMPVVFLDHPITAARLADLGFDEKLKSKNITRAPKQNYVNMMHIMKQAAVVVTDSGGLQEESYYLNVPCIVHRAATERDEGLGENVVLTGLSAENLTKELSQFKTKLKRKTTREFKPTEIIIKDFKKRGFF